MSDINATNVNGRAIEPERVKAICSLEANATINHSYNVSSAADGGIGILTVNYSSVFIGADYPSVSSPDSGASDTISGTNSATAKTIYTWSSSHALVDRAAFMASFGDLA